MDGCLVEERRLTLVSDPRSARAARALVREVLGEASDKGWIDSAELAVSELVTNAVLHARTPLEVLVRVEGDHVRIEVTDSSDLAPVVRSPGQGATTGRGLAIVASVSSSFGVERRPDGGKVVWCTIAD